ncbi:hypothetical protein D7V97_05060 [Corallococcus sp. CA053C]|uniref:hypothetical protein n=1 Tax=Corallococcus sp. CA053C TaxID=2316732 RepID=UPI000EA26555|nr:hypothetical protein [Corallococcus sp. CA053C]RKH13586.1 hypothetical protein D7V97_05060 [Corallococcus sp. CA053C]
MPIAYRSVRVVLQNSTDDVMTVEGTEVLLGAWSSGLGLKNGDTLERQSARAFATESIVLQRGTQAYARLGSQNGYLNVQWHLPWIGDFTCDVTFASPLRHVAIRVNDDEPASIAVLVTVTQDRVASSAVPPGS